MTDLRNNGSNDSAPVVPEEIRRSDAGFGEKHVLNDNGGLSSFHHFAEDDEGGNTGKLIGGALIVALLLGGTGLYFYTSATPAPMASKAPASLVASNTPAPIQTAPISPPTATPVPDATSGTTAKTPSDAAPASASDTASVTPAVKADKPVKSARAHVVKDDAAQNAAEAGQTAQLNRDSSAADRATRNGSVAVPLPTPPAPPASSVASNGQPVAPESSAPAQNVPAAPAVAPEQQPAATVPAPQPDQAAQPQ